MTDKIQPVGKRVLARKNQKDELVKGIIMPDTAKNKKFDIEVLALGDDITCVKVGQKISISQYDCKEITLDDQTYLLVPEIAILAIIHD